ncbi:hypothetical protein [Actinomycetospora flava]|uniref:Uncharacterized protein n=1 Tax=Actinomycetospora flava TaxID=3129232 RepID=A0ABU8MI17_9PSEU
MQWNIGSVHSSPMFHIAGLVHLRVMWVNGCAFSGKHVGGAAAVVGAEERGGGAVLDDDEQPVGAGVGQEPTHGPRGHRRGRGHALDGHAGDHPGAPAHPMDEDLEHSQGVGAAVRATGERGDVLAREGQRFALVDDNTSSPGDAGAPPPGQRELARGDAAGLAAEAAVTGAGACEGARMGTTGRITA